MKKIISLFMVLTMVLSLAACSTNQSPSESTPEKQPDSSAEAQQPTDEAGKTLVVYYSATGNTENVANYIATATDGDLFELEPAEPYSDADLNWTDDNSRVVREHDDESLRDIELVADTVENWDSYDTVFIGYPIWWGLAPRIVNTFIESHDLKGRTVIPFATSGGSGIANSVAELQKAYPGLNWQEGRLLNRTDEKTVRQWVEALGY